MLNKCSFHSSIYKLAADNSVSSLCDIYFLNLVIDKLPLKILFCTSIFSYPELMCEQHVTSIKPGIYTLRTGK
ncbi:hypothetical protein H8958_009887 [Nasalis larvatus]